MRNPLRRSRKKIFMGGEGMRLLWKMYPQAAFFEVYVPAGGEGTTAELPLIVESTESRLIEPYTKMFYRLFAARDRPLFRLLFMNVNCRPAIAHRIAANLAIMLASEDIVTCLLDFDVQGSDLHDLFHVDQAPGMVEYLMKGVASDRIIRKTGVPELQFIPSGNPLADPDEILSILGWSNTLDELIPSGVVGLIYTGTGQSFDMSELMSEVDGTLLLFSSGERIDRSIRKVLKRVKRRSEVVGVIWTNPMVYPFQRTETTPIQESFPVIDAMQEEGVPEEDAVPVIESQHLNYEGEERAGSGSEGEGTRFEGGTGKGLGREEDVTEDVLKSGGDRNGEEDKIADDEIIGVEGIEEEKGGEDEEGAGKKMFWFAFLGVFFTILLLLVLYYWGDNSSERQVTELETRGIPAEVIPEEETVRTSEPAPQAPGEETGGIRRDIFTESSNVPFSLILGSFRERSSADRGKEQLNRAGFDPYLVPVEIPGQGRWIRLMLGQYSNEEEAEEGLREVVAGSNFKEGRIVESPIAYLLGGFSTMEEAERAAANADAEGLDVYTLVSGGEEKIYFLYLGAFENEGQAGYLGEIVKEYEMKGELVKRRGFRL